MPFKVQYDAIGKKKYQTYQEQDQKETNGFTIKYVSLK